MAAKRQMLHGHQDVTRGVCAIEEVLELLFL